MASFQLNTQILGAAEKYVAILERLYGKLYNMKMM
jgi:hypothetical protein